MAIAALALGLPPAAAAAERNCSGPTGDQYCSPITEVITAGGGSDSDGSPSADDPGGLPFTGLDLGLSLAAGAGLLGAGIVLRRAARARGTV